MARDPSDSPIPEQRRLPILLVARFLVAIACVTALIALEGGQIISSPRYKYAYFLLLLVCVADLFYIPLFRTVRTPLKQGLIQAVVDLLAVTALVYLNEGVFSPFVLLYFGPAVVSAVYFSTLGAILFGAVSVGLLLGIAALFHGAFHYDWILPLVSRDTLELHKVFPKVAGETVLPAVGILGVAVLASRLVTISSRERVVMEEILHGMGDGVVTVDGQEKIVFINPAARDLLSLPDDFLPLGKSFQGLLSAARLKDHLAKKKVGTTGSFTAEVGSDEGVQRVLHVTPSPVKGPPGKDRGTVYLLRDLTAQKRMEEAVKKADRLQDISEMAAGIAHEIRNPLASIRGSIQELHTSDLLHEDDKRLMKVILRECDRLNRITEDFIHFAERRTMALLPCNIGNLLSDIESLLHRRPERGASTIRVDKEGDLNIHADGEGIRQVLMNLCLNALEAMNGSGSLHIRAFPKRALPPPKEGGKAPASPLEGVGIDIADTGCGIPPEIQDRIFHPFYSTKPKGFGLGLSLVYRIVDAHLGTVTVASHPGTGSTFTVWLPRNLQDETGARPGAPSVPSVPLEGGEKDSGKPS
ncbi:MAG: two-component system sensor histidine kinase NtrB [Planctomycetota bacterium]|jgi:two-component system sensor histidine kinase PilS (NtrC family)